MLSVRNLQSAYGRSQVLFDVELDIAEGEVVTLLGRNGMGKTTTVRSIMGLLAPKGGDIRFESRDVRGIAPEKIARCGIGLVPEGRQVFPTLSVRENLVATASNRLKRNSPWTLSKSTPLSSFAGARRPVGPHPLGRRAADARSRPRADDQSEAPDPRRGDGGLAPVIRAEIWGCIEALKAQGQSIPADRQEHQCAQAHRRPALHHREGPHGLVGHEHRPR